MRFLSVLSAITVAIARAELDDSQPPSAIIQQDLTQPVPEIIVVKANSAYVVNLECLKCPLAIQQVDNEVVWQLSQQKNALRLQFTIDTLNGSEPTLLLNGHRILPLGPMPLNINAWQIPTNIRTGDINSLWSGPSPGTVQLPLTYEHTVLRTEEPGEAWVQFDVTGLPLGRTDDPRSPYLNAEPVKLDVQGQKLVQILLQHQNETNGMSIADVQVVPREDRAQPHLMKCGSLAMVRTTFDPSEWDEYGQFGTWPRLQNLMMGELGDLQHSPLIFPVALFLMFGIVMLRRCCHRRREQMVIIEDDAEIALLSIGYEDAPPAYADIPIIKIEEYD